MLKALGLGHRKVTLPAVGFLLLGHLALFGCGRILQPPTAVSVIAASATPTDTPRPTATRRATFTPVPATPSDTPTPTATPTPIIYVIKKGDTLLPIARQFGVTVEEIQRVNGITDPRRLRIDQEIIIPPREGVAGPTVVPTPTPVALKIQGLAFYRTPVDSLWCLGEVLNVSGQPAEEVQVRISLHDEQGRLLAAGQAFTQLDILAAGSRAPFAVLFSAPPTSFAQYQTQILGGVLSTHLGPRYPDLEVMRDQGQPLDQENYQVQGEVHNTGQADAERVAVVVTLYDEQDRVVAARAVDIAVEMFLAGAQAPFDVILTPLGQPARYDVQVQGWWIGYQPPMLTETPTPAATP